MLLLSFLETSLPLSPVFWVQKKEEINHKSTAFLINIRACNIYKCLFPLYWFVFGWYKTKSHGMIYIKIIKLFKKGFRQSLYQLHIYIKILLQLSNLQIDFLKFWFFILQKWEYQYEKINEKTIATKLRETILTMTNHNLHKSNWLKKRELKYMPPVQNITQE